MAKLVKCYYCGEMFDRETEEFGKPTSNRYAHKHCYDKAQSEKTQDEKDYEALTQYIKKKFNMNVISAKVIRQISDYKKQFNFTYSGMLKALIWWFDVKKNTLEATNGGIGILPYIYNDAKTYYYGLWMAQNINSEKDLANFHIRTEEIEISSPRRYVQPPRLFDIERESEDGK